MNRLDDPVSRWTRKGRGGVPMSRVTKYAPDCGEEPRSSVLAPCGTLEATSGVYTGSSHGAGARPSPPILAFFGVASIGENVRSKLTRVAARSPLMLNPANP